MVIFNVGSEAYWTLGCPKERVHLPGKLRQVFNLAEIRQFLTYDFDTFRA